MTGEINSDYEMGRLREAVDRLTSTWQIQDTAATNGRKELHRKFDDLSHKFGELNNSVESLSARIGKIEPVVRGVEIADLRSAGVRRLAKFVWFALVALLGAFGREFIGLFHR